MQDLRWKLILIAGITAAFAILAWIQEVNLGLDLRGGIYLVLRVDVDEAVQAEVRDDIDAFRRYLGDQGVPVESAAAVSLLEGVITTPTEVDMDRALDLAGDWFSTYDLRRSGTTLRVTLQAQPAATVRDGAMRQAIQTIRNRVDEYGVAEPVVQQQGLSGDRILVQLPGVENPDRVKALLRNTALLELKLVEIGPADSRQALVDAREGVIPPSEEILEAEPEDGFPAGYYLVQRDPVVTGRDLKTARIGQDEMGLPSVNFTLDAEAADRFDDVTSSNIGRQLAIVLDDRVYSAPVIEGRISNNGQIRGGFSFEEAEDLALVLRAGALPASIEYLEERSVGPSLGRESIDRGVRAALVGLAIVVAFMLAYYRGAGINAIIALALNLIVVLGVMNTLGAAFTLPGIAGVILLIGMAVDANVLIFERIREELDNGKTVRASIDTGFGKAFSAIIDANITTLVAAVFLFQFGTGAVKGFAVTLSIGIMASMFTAIFVSRAMFDLWTLRNPRSLSI